MRKLFVAAVFVPLSIAAFMDAAAQPAGQPPAATASAPVPPGPGSGPRRGRGPHFGRDNTPGWSMMTPAEREEHRQKMRGAQTREQCNAVMEEHRQKMAERAKSRGREPLMQPRRDACAGRFP
jgi:hypothetical protein